jgi:hypothetical protein
MGKMNIALDDKVEERFRKAVFQSKGMKKGNISNALEEAINLWINQEIERRAKDRKDEKDGI